MKSIIKIILVFWVLMPAVNAKPTVEEKYYNHLQLGTVNIDSASENLSANKHIVLGFKFLHAFMYDMARAQFIKAQSIDKHAALAYYGDIMSHKHILWQYENRKDAQAAITKSKKYIQFNKLSPLEQTLLNSSYLLLEAKLSSKQRYLNTIKYLSKQKLKVNHLELELLLVLIKLGFISEFPYENVSKQWLDTGRASIDELFNAHPSHPGAIHYHLHYFDSDNPNIAKKALGSAQAAAKTLSSSSHLAHMSAHIYRRLGMWQAFMIANQKAVKASDALCAVKHFRQGNLSVTACDAENRYHALEWLQYGAFKTGNKKTAIVALQRMQKDSDALQQDLFYAWYYRMWARYYLWTSTPTPLITIRPITKKNESTYWMAYSECGVLLANGVSKLKHMQNIEVELARFERVNALAKSLTDPYVYYSCQMNQYLLLAAKAKHKEDIARRNALLSQAATFEKKLISTEATPSLNFISVEDFSRKY